MQKIAVSMEFIAKRILNHYNKLLQKDPTLPFYFNKTFKDFPYKNATDNPHFRSLMERQKYLNQYPPIPVRNRLKHLKFFSYPSKIYHDTLTSLDAPHDLKRINNILGKASDKLKKQIKILANNIEHYNKNYPTQKYPTDSAIYAANNINSTLSKTKKDFKSFLKILNNLKY